MNNEEFVLHTTKYGGLAQQDRQIRGGKLPVRDAWAECGWCFTEPKREGSAFCSDSCAKEARNMVGGRPGRLAGVALVLGFAVMLYGTVSLIWCFITR